MSERVKVTSKTPESKKDNSVSQTRNTDFSQSTSSPIDQILFLQKTIGNQAVQRLFKSGVIQAKLRIGRRNDIYEQEADRVAEQVMRMPEQVRQQPLAEEEEEIQPAQIKSLLPRQSIEEEEEEELQMQPLGEEEELLQTREVSGRSREGTAVFEDRVNSIRNRGQPLPASVRSFFAPRFGYDFSGVRVHTDSHATEAAQAVNAKAFTIGKDIVFGSGQYAPQTSEGKQLLAHELTHVLQQQHLFKAEDVIQREALYVRSKRPSASSTTGHAYITLEDEQNRRQSWGFYAVCAAGPLGAEACTNAEILHMLVGAPSVVRSDSGTTFDDSIRYPITEDRYRTALSLVRYRRRTPPAYNLISYACVHFVQDIARCAGISIPNLPGIDEPADLSRYIRRELDMRLLRSGALLIGREGGGSTVDLRERATFRVSGLPREHTIRFRWALQDSQRRCYSMMGPSGPVSRFGPQPSAFIPPETRQLLRSRNIRRGTVTCQAFTAYVLRGLHMPVTFTW